jgi:hypothetical protein
MLLEELFNPECERNRNEISEKVEESGISHAGLVKTLVHSNDTGCSIYLTLDFKFPTIRNLHIEKA